MEIQTILGLIAATLTTISFVPQVWRTWKMKETRDISLFMYLLFCSGIALWLAYGLWIQDLPLIAANIITLILSSSVLFLKLKYG